MIYTSNFAKYKKYKNEYKGVAIVRYAPKWWDGENIPELSPSSELLAKYKLGKIDDEEFKKQYFNQLDNVEHLDSILTNLDNKVLLCYCAKESFCHRHILREYLLEKKQILSQELP